jgi:hypothetical protein
MSRGAPWRNSARSSRKLASSSTFGPTDCGSQPSADHELPPGTVQGSAERLAEYLAPYREAGCGQVQVRFPAHSIEELVDQIVGFGDGVIPLVNR